MKPISRAIAILLASTALGFAGEGWLTDWEAAKAKSKAENKPILINLTGSDWCASCIKIKKEVFSQKAFKNFAAENLILMEADFPKKTEQSAELKKQNAELEKQYVTDGYPTVFLLDSEGKKLSEDLGDSRAVRTRSSTNSRNSSPRQKSNPIPIRRILEDQHQEKAGSGGNFSPSGPGPIGGWFKIPLGEGTSATGAPRHRSAAEHYFVKLH